MTNHDVLVEYGKSLTSGIAGGLLVIIFFNNETIPFIKFIWGCIFFYLFFIVYFIFSKSKDRIGKNKG